MFLIVVVGRDCNSLKKFLILRFQDSSDWCITMKHQKRFQVWLGNTLNNNTVRCNVWCVAVLFRHSCLPVFAWRRVVLHIFNPKQLLRVSCILWCYLSKWLSIKRLLLLLQWFHEYVTECKSHRKILECRISNIVIVICSINLYVKFSYNGDDF